MKKLVLTTLLVSTGVLATTISASAAEPTTQEYNSDLSIKFEKESGSNSEGPFSGQLSFTWSPKNYNFGSQKIKLGTGVSYDLESASKDSQYLVVNEDRNDKDTEFGKAWNVKVKMSELSVDNAGTDKLPATLTLGLGELQQYHIGTALNNDGTDVDPAKPWEKDVLTPFAEQPSDVEIKGTDSEEGLGKLVSIPADGLTEVEVMAQTSDREEADKKREGWGTKINSQNLKFVTLDSSVAEKEYKGNLTWTLSRDIK